MAVGMHGKYTRRVSTVVLPALGILKKRGHTRKQHHSEEENHHEQEPEHPDEREHGPRHGDDHQPELMEGSHDPYQAHGFPEPQETENSHGASGAACEADAGEDHCDHGQQHNHGVTDVYRRVGADPEGNSVGSEADQKFNGESGSENRLCDGHPERERACGTPQIVLLESFSDFHVAHHRNKDGVRKNDKRGGVKEQMVVHHLLKPGPRRLLDPSLSLP